MSGAPPSRAPVVAAGIFLSRIFGLAREVLMARYLGVGAHSDVYGVTFRLPNLLQNLLGEQTLSAAFIPGYARMLEEGREREAGRFAGAIFGLLVGVAGGLSLVGILLARPLVAIFAPGFVGDAAAVAAGTMEVDRYALAVAMVRIIFPMAGLLVLASWSLAVLNSHRRFFVPYVAPVLWNVSIIAVLWWVGEPLFQADGALAFDDRSRLLVAVAWGALVGGGLQFAVQLPFVARVLRGFRPSVSVRVEGVAPALRAFAPLVASRGVVQLSAYLDYFLGSLLAAGAVGALTFSLRLYLLPISLFAISVAAAELPELARLDRESAAARALRLTAGLRQMAFLTVPTVVGYLGFGALIVGAVYRSGEFGAEDHALVTLVLAAYTLGLLPTTSSRVYQNLFYSLDDTRFPAKVAVARVATSATVGVAAMLWLDRFDVSGLTTAMGLEPTGKILYLGAVGLALGSAVGAWLEAVLLVREGRRRVPGATVPWGAGSRMLAIALVAGLVGWFGSGFVVGPWWLRATVTVGGYAAVYLGLSALVGAPELRAWLGRRARGEE